MFPIIIEWLLLTNTVFLQVHLFIFSKYNIFLPTFQPLPELKRQEVSQPLSQEKALLSPILVDQKKNPEV